METKFSSHSLGDIDMLYHSGNTLNSGLKYTRVECYTADIRENSSSTQTRIAICPSLEETMISRLKENRRLP
jgi:hypothetical protein